MNPFDWFKKMIGRKDNSGNQLINKINELSDSAEEQIEGHPAVTLVGPDGSLATQKQMKTRAVEVAIENIDSDWMDEETLKEIYSPTNLMVDNEVKEIMAEYISGKANKEETKSKLENLL